MGPLRHRPRTTPAASRLSCPRTPRPREAPGEAPVPGLFFVNIRRSDPQCLVGLSCRRRPDQQRGQQDNCGDTAIQPRRTVASAATDGPASAPAKAPVTVSTMAHSTRKVTSCVHPLARVVHLPVFPVERKERRDYRTADKAQENLTPHRRVASPQLEQCLEGDAATSPPPGRQGSRAREPDRDRSS